MIIKLINQGITTSLTRKGEIIIDGKKYAIKFENIELMLEEIAKKVIDQKNDVLAEQYQNHKPIFKKSEGGMKLASSDIQKIIHSIAKEDL